jgi:hypothetical protein
VLVYSIILFVVAVLFTAIGIAIYRGRIDLIHDYHQIRVADKSSYGEAFGKAVLVIAITLLLSSVIGLFDNCVVLAVMVLIIGLLIGIGSMIAVQKKYNHGVF